MIDHAKNITEEYAIVKTELKKYKEKYIEIQDELNNYKENYNKLENEISDTSLTTTKTIEILEEKLKLLQKTIEDKDKLIESLRRENKIDNNKKITIIRNADTSKNKLTRNRSRTKNENNDLKDSKWFRMYSTYSQESFATENVQELISESHKKIRNLLNSLMKITEDKKFKLFQACYKKIFELLLESENNFTTRSRTRNVTNKENTLSDFNIIRGKTIDENKKESETKSNSDFIWQTKTSLPKC